MTEYSEEGNIVLLFWNYKLSSRNYWMTSYQQHWFEYMWNLRNEPTVMKLFQKEFRIFPDTFAFIVNVVNGPMSRQNTVFREAVEIQKRIAIAVWRLATGNAYRVVSKVFAISEATVNDVVLQFCAVLTMIAQQFIRFPITEEETARMIDLFRISTNCGIPQVVGCLDSTHCQIISPDVQSKASYINRKQAYSINTQAIVGERLKFIDVATGFPGSVHDARVLRSSSLFTRAEGYEILNLPQAEILHHNIKPMILADGAYPPLRWILKPYARHRNLTPEEVNFNTTLSQARSAVERAFGLLKTRWRCLYKKLEQNLENIPMVIIACCVLHNICQDRNYEVLDDEDRAFLEAVIAEEQDERNRNRNQNFCDNFNQQRIILTQFLQ